MLMLPTIPLGGGIIPVLFLAFGLYMMKKSEDFSHLSTAVKNTKIYLWLGFLLFLGLALYCVPTSFAEDSWYRQDEEFIDFLAISFRIAAYIVLINTLFLSPLMNHRDWVVKNGIFSNKPKIIDPPQEEQNINIIKGEKFKAYSVADELLKWAKLKEDSLITEEEFNDARKKLLQRH